MCSILVRIYSQQQDDLQETVQQSLVNEMLNYTVQQISHQYLLAMPRGISFMIISNLMDIETVRHEYIVQKIPME
jgi:hypothetical protein